MEVSMSVSVVEWHIARCSAPLQMRPTLAAIIRQVTRRQLRDISHASILILLERAPIWLDGTTSEHHRHCRVKPGKPNDDEQRVRQITRSPRRKARASGVEG